MSGIKKFIFGGHIIISFFCCICCQQNETSSDIRGYFFSCSETRTFVYFGYKNDKKLYKKEISVHSCEYENNECVIVLHEIKDDLRGTPEKKNYEYIINPRAIKRVFQYQEETHQDTLLKAPIKIGNFWYATETVTYIANGKSILKKIKCAIANKYANEVLGKSRECIDIVCDESTLTFCKGLGLFKADFTDFHEILVEILPKGKL